MNSQLSQQIFAATILVVLAFPFNRCHADNANRQPNIVLIMADDLGRECLQCYGSESYKTPHLDRIAREGARFTHCYSTPICTTSRVQIMTGKYNHHNYDCFAYLNPREITFANVMKEAGYKTMIAGKWQLNGHNDRPRREGWDDTYRPKHFGFDEWHLWQVHERKRERYWGADLVVNGKTQRMPDETYSPDYFVDRICEFMDRNKESPFLVYYPMLLTHDPFIRTPASKNKNPHKSKAFAGMVNYTDKLIGRIDQKLKDLNIAENTLLIFTGDNGTHRSIQSVSNGKTIKGGKALTINDGIHVPLICKWPGKIEAGQTVNGIVDFTDMMPTLHKLSKSNATINTDGMSILPALGLETGPTRKWSLCHYDCRWGKFPSRQFAVNQKYKVYRHGGIYNFVEDPLERKPLNQSELPDDDIAIIKGMKSDLKKFPPLKAASLVAGPRRDHKPEKPNLILMMADDLGWGDVGFNGGKIIKTPSLDAMAAAGLKFDRFYAQSAVCSPTRGSCLTGRHPFRYGIYGANVGHLNKNENTLAEFLKQNGYRTGHFGKWHLGTLSPDFSGKANRNPKKNYMPPSAAGFDEWFSTEYAVATWNPYDPANSHTRKHAGDPRILYWQNGTNVTKPQSGDDSRIIMDRVIPFIDDAEETGQPFFAVVWFHAPHKPVVASPQHRAPYSDHPETAQHYYGCISAMDEQIGRLRKHLKEREISENTILCFCSDNGPEGRKAGEGTSWGQTSGLRGRKRSLYEGGIRVPAVIEWPQRIKPGSESKKPFVTSDYFPTMVEILDGDAGLIRNCDGMSMVRLFDGIDRRNKGIGFRDRKRWVWMNDRYKILVGANDESELYDLQNDRSERKNLADKNARVLESLRAELTQWQESF